MELARTLLDGLKLVFVVVPRRPAQRIGPGAYWLSLALLGAALALESWWLAGETRTYVPLSLHGLAFIGVLALLIAYVSALFAQRPGLLWPLATLIVVSQLWIEVLMWPVEQLALPNTPLSTWAQEDIARNLWIVLSLIALRRAFDYLEPHRGAAVRSVAALACGAALLVPLFVVSPWPVFYDAPAEEPVPDDSYVEAPSFDPERVMARQERLVDSALAALEPHRSGVVDLYLVAFGGDGSERVFRNEVEYVERLYATRFGAKGRTIALLNSPDTVETRPLATRRNLRRALRGVAARLDPTEDIVLLFLTSHGSEDHELYVGLDPLPLAPLTPRDVDAALDDAGFEWRVVVVSACYSGGFLPELEGPGSLVISAARADRSSFGCGAESDFTWFGRAFFIEALNETASPIEAFRRAEARIEAWERDEERVRSLPQIRSDDAIEARLARWLEGLQPGPAVPFDPPAGAAAAAAAGDQPPS